MKLGKLKEIDIRKVWEHEQYDFSKWLAGEENIQELETIINELESGEVALDDAINKYTEAMKLSKECSDKLNEVTETVNKILTDNGKLEDFEVKE